MKKALVLAGLLAGFACDTFAVPYLEIRFYQENWYVFVEATPKGFETPTGEPGFGVDWYDGDTYMGFGGVRGRNGYLVSEALQFTVKEWNYNFRYILNDQEHIVYGPSFTIEMPTGERPQQDPNNPVFGFGIRDESEFTWLLPLPQTVPDTSGGVFLSLMGFGSVILLSQLRKNSFSRS